MQLPPYSHKNRAFTLVEIMVSVVILGIISVALSSMYIYSLKTANINANNLRLTEQIRSLNEAIARDSKSAGQYVVYNNFDDVSRLKMGQGELGNYCVFHYLNSDNLIYKSIGYYVLSSSSSSSPSALKKHTSYWNTPYTQAQNIPLPTVATSSQHEVLVDKVVGTFSTNKANYLFKSHDDNKLIGKGQVFILNPSGASKSGPSQIHKDFSFMLLLES